MQYISPKNTLYDKAELISIVKQNNGSLLTAVLLDDSQFEYMVYYGYSKRYVLTTTKNLYHLKG